MSQIMIADLKENPKYPTKRERQNFLESLFVSGETVATIAHLTRQLGSQMTAGVVSQVLDKTRRQLLGEQLPEDQDFIGEILNLIKKIP